MSVFVIAEIGVNHQGDMNLVVDLVDSAKAAGADAAKFQCFDAKLLGRPEIAKYELSRERLDSIAAYCERIGIEFMCTPFDVDALHFLTPLVKRMKIASGCITNVPLLEAARNSDLPIILSTGMSAMDEVDVALNTLEWRLGLNITLLHCTSAYPCPIEDVNLKAMQSLKKRMKLPVGYSDHTDGIAVPIAAVALGATVIEKHLTLDRSLPGPDHKASITPREFRAMVMAIHDIEKALGDGVKRPMPSEEPVRKIWHANALRTHNAKRGYSHE